MFHTIYLIKILYVHTYIQNNDIIYLCNVYMYFKTKHFKLTCLFYLNYYTCSMYIVERVKILILYICIYRILSVIVSIN